jgi:hypothetical protein
VICRLLLCHVFFFGDKQLMASAVCIAQLEVARKEVDLEREADDMKVNDNASWV